MNSKDVFFPLCSFYRWLGTHYIWKIKLNPCLQPASGTTGQGKSALPYLPYAPRKSKPFSEPLLNVSFSFTISLKFLMWLTFCTKRHHSFNSRRYVKYWSQKIWELKLPELHFIRMYPCFLTLTFLVFSSSPGRKHSVNMCHIVVL